MGVGSNEVLSDLSGAADTALRTSRHRCTRLICHGGEHDRHHRLDPRYTVCIFSAYRCFSASDGLFVPGYSQCNGSAA